MNVFDNVSNVRQYMMETGPGYDQLQAEFTDWWQTRLALIAAVEPWMLACIYSINRLRWTAGLLPAARLIEED